MSWFLCCSTNTLFFVILRYYETFFLVLLQHLLFSTMSSGTINTDANPSSSIKRVAIVTGGSRGIGRGISEQLVSTGDYAGLLLTYNTNRAAAEKARDEFMDKYPILRKIELVGGDLAREETRDDLFHTLEREFPATAADDDTRSEGKDRDGWALATVVHNAGQYVGITSENSEGIEAKVLEFGNGSLLRKQSDGDDKGRIGTKTVDLEVMRYYQRLYGDAWVDICERSLDRMRRSADADGRFRGSLIGISSPGCNLLMRPGPDYSMPGSGKSLMEYSMRIFALNAASLGVNCNIVVPGITKTQAWERLVEHKKLDLGDASNLWESDMMKKYVAGVPMKEAVDPKDIGDAVVFLSSPSGGGRFITGQALIVDGGLNMKR